MLTEPSVTATLCLLNYRSAFILHSVRYLFTKTYEPSDDLSIANLMNYLNIAMPQDKHEEFDIAEVTKSVTALSSKGELVLQGDIVRCPSR